MESEEDDTMGESAQHSWSSFSVCEGIHWFSCGRNEKLTEIDIWCQNLFPLISYSRPKAKQLLLVNILWKQPSLIELPRNYDVIFQFYHKRKCHRCKSVPKDPALCLFCGSIVCLREFCCKIQRGDNYIHETVGHSQECGGGTGVFLAVNASTIVVIRGKRACIWGSVYLDSFGEEDKELKRGKPLFLHLERYKLLEHQWINHKFDHTSRKWIMHRDLI